MKFARSISCLTECLPRPSTLVRLPSAEPHWREFMKSGIPWSVKESTGSARGSKSSATIRLDAGRVAQQPHPGTVGNCDAAISGSIHPRVRDRFESITEELAMRQWSGHRPQPAAILSKPGPLQTALLISISAGTRRKQRTLSHEARFDQRAPESHQYATCPTGRTGAGFGG